MSSRATESFPAKLVSSGSVTSVYWCTGLLLPLQRQDLAFIFAELDETPVGPFLQNVKVSLKANTTLWSISHRSQFHVLPKLAKSVSLLQASKEFVNMYRM